MNIKLYNQPHLIKLYIKYINDHNKLPTKKQYTEINKDVLMEVTKDKIKNVLKSFDYYEGSLIQVTLIKANDSIDKKDVTVSFSITKISDNGTIHVKLSNKKF